MLSIAFHLAHPHFQGIFHLLENKPHRPISSVPRYRTHRRIQQRWSMRPQYPVQVTEGVRRIAPMMIHLLFHQRLLQGLRVVGHFVRFSGPILIIAVSLPPDRDVIASQSAILEKIKPPSPEPSVSLPPSAFPSADFSPVPSQSAKLNEVYAQQKTC